jgi:hypothetical protein
MTVETGINPQMLPTATHMVEKIKDIGCIVGIPIWHLGCCEDRVVYGIEQVDVTTLSSSYTLPWCYYRVHSACHRM